MQSSNELRWIDYLIILIYFVFVLGIGFVLKTVCQNECGFSFVRQIDSGLDRRVWPFSLLIWGRRK